MYFPLTLEALTAKGTPPRDLSLAEYIRGVPQYKTEDTWKPMFGVSANKDVFGEKRPIHPRPSRGRVYSRVS